MNVIFTAALLLSATVLCIKAPSAFLPAALDGVLCAAKCCLTLFCVYALWMGLSAVADDCGLTKKTGKLLAPVCSKLFRTDNAEATRAISMNVSCNLLGIGGAATPYGVKAINALEKDGNSFAQDLLFIINATSIQLVPTTVVALRASAGSVAAYDIVLPSLIATAVSTACGALIYLLSDKIKAKKKRKCNT